MWGKKKGRTMEKSIIILIDKELQRLHNSLSTNSFYDDGISAYRSAINKENVDYYVKKLEFVGRRVEKLEDFLLSKGKSIDK